VKVPQLNPEVFPDVSRRRVPKIVAADSDSPSPALARNLPWPEEIASALMHDLCADSFLENRQRITKKAMVRGFLSFAVPACAVGSTWSTETHWKIFPLLRLF